MTHLAKEFGLSDVAMHKICRKHHIPNPPLGWWSKKAAGQNVKVTPLPAHSRGAASQILIASADRRDQADALSEAREQARVRVSAYSDELGEAHPIIERTLAALRREKLSEKGLVTVAGPGIIKCEVAPVSIDRLALALRRLTSACRLQGFELSATDSGSSFISEAGSVGLEVKETFRRVDHVLTETERAKLKAWEDKRDRAVRRDSWTWGLHRPEFEKWDYHPTGELSLELSGNYGLYPSPRRSFRDATVQRLENMSADISVGIAVFAAAQAQEKARRDEEERKAEDQKREREAAARSKHIEKRRRNEVTDLLEYLEETEHLRALLEALPPAPENDADKRYAAFREWATRRIEILAERLTPNGLQERFTKHRIFGDDDDFDYEAPRRW